jgi:hypothetical protein
MRWLLAVFIVSLCTLLWSAFSVARHIRRDANGEPRNGASPAVAEVTELKTEPEPK